MLLLDRDNVFLSALNSHESSHSSLSEDFGSLEDEFHSSFDSLWSMDTAGSSACRDSYQPASSKRILASYFSRLQGPQQQQNYQPSHPVGFDDEDDHVIRPLRLTNWQERPCSNNVANTRLRLQRCLPRIPEMRRVIRRKSHNLTPKYAMQVFPGKISFTPRNMKDMEVVPRETVICKERLEV